MLLTAHFNHTLLDYRTILLNIAVVSVVAGILLILNYFIRQKTSNRSIVDLKSSSTYECGFDTFSELFSHSVDVQFFLVSIMFLIFDVELALIFP